MVGAEPGGAHAASVDPARLNRSGQGPLLVGRAEARPEVHDGAVRRVVAGDVEALARRRVAQAAVGLGRPVLRARAVAGPELDLGAVGGAAAGDVQALAQRPD